MKLSKVFVQELDTVLRFVHLGREGHPIENIFGLLNKGVAFNSKTRDALRNELVSMTVHSRWGLSKNSGVDAFVDTASKAENLFSARWTVFYASGALSSHRSFRTVPGVLLQNARGDLDVAVISSDARWSIYPNDPQPGAVFVSQECAASGLLDLQARCFLLLKTQMRYDNSFEIIGGLTLYSSPVETRQITDAGDYDHRGVRFELQGDWGV